MALEAIKTVTGTGVYIPGDDIDTDRIIPARYMKCVTFDDLGEYLFYDVRYSEDGQKRGHVLDDPRHGGAGIMISGRNFGCGSSREHAPQAIYRFGFRGIIAESFAEIFFGNSTTLGIPCLTLDPVAVREIGLAVQENPELDITLDVENLEVRAGGKTYPAQMPDTAQKALTSGHWDPIADLLEGLPDVEKTVENLPYVANA
jgi:3-isopropylmalate/(R)-2-methylmalate dehydratase small subunit